MINSPEQIYRSALSAVKSILASEDVLEVHKKELLSVMIWKITERYGKFNAEYLSVKAKKVLNSNQSRLEKIQQLAHDHVYTRKYLIQGLIDKPRDYKSILKKAVGCVVTRKEHTKLSRENDVEGWDRFKESKIDYEKNTQIT